MVLPAILSGLASGVGSAAVGAIGNLLGGGSKQPSAGEFLNEYINIIRPLWSELNNEYNREIDSSRSRSQELINQYTSPQALLDFTNNAQSLAETAFAGIESGALTPAQGKDMFMNWAYDAGANPGNFSNLPAFARDFDQYAIGNSQEFWNKGLNRTFEQLTGRAPTEAERQKFNQSTYQNQEQVAEALKNTYEVAKRFPTSDMDAMAQWYYGGRRVERFSPPGQTSFSTAQTTSQPTPTLPTS